MSITIRSGAAPAFQAFSRACARAALSASSRRGSLGDSVDDPKRRRIRGDRPAQRLLVANRAQVGQAVAAVGDITARSRTTRPGPCRLRRSRIDARPRDSASVGPEPIGRLGQQASPGVRHLPLSVRRDIYREGAAITVHLQGDPPEPGTHA